MIRAVPCGDDRPNGLAAVAPNPSDPYESIVVPFVSGAGTLLASSGDPIESVTDTGKTPVVGQEGILECVSASASTFIGIDIPFDLF